MLGCVTETLDLAEVVAALYRLRMRACKAEDTVGARSEIKWRSAER